MNLVIETTQKIYDRDALAERCARLRAEGKVVVATGGCFDLLHVGHVRYLQAARAQGDCLVVLLNSDASVQALKGPTRPIVAQESRAEILAALACVDYLVIFDELSPAPTLRHIKPNIFCKGAEYAPPHGKPLPVEEVEAVASYEGSIHYLPMIPDNSTTRLVERILQEQERAACRR